MSMDRYVPVCPWCGKRGTPTSTSTPGGPSSDAASRISGKCTGNPSGSDKHGGSWVKVN